MFLDQPVILFKVVVYSLITVELLDNLLVAPNVPGVAGVQRVGLPDGLYDLGSPLLVFPLQPL